ncbi:hypothetical protein [Flavobacterium caeni]|uniref:hypothetical protein n=1 Tax=Flavobacterium caeni TaxID=490189 RepID=UPI0011131AA2|nr:hypothetical protein [Flavobacterium caeni]
MEKSTKQNHLWLKNHFDWKNAPRPLKVNAFLPEGIFDRYIGILPKVGIIEEFPFDEFISDARTEGEISVNRKIWNDFPQSFRETDEGFVEISSRQLLAKFNIPHHGYKNDYLLPNNTRAIRFLENKTKDLLS